MLKKSWINYLLIIFGVSVFILNSVFRSSIGEISPITIPPSLIVPNNIAIISLVIIGCIYLRNRDINLTYFRWYLMPLLIIYICIVIFSNTRSLYSVAGEVLWQTIVPALILVMFVFPHINTGKVVYYFLLIFNIVYSIAFLTGIVDYFIGGRINEIIATYFSSPDWANMIRTQQNVYGFRMITLFGAPLMNAYFALVMLVLNVCYERVYKVGIFNKYFIYILTLVTIFLTGSRTALILSFLFILFIEFFARLGFIKFIVMAVLLIAITYTPIFQNTIGMRLNGDMLFSGDARFKMIDMVFNNRFGEIFFLNGNGYNYSRLLTSTAFNETSANFELPVLMFAYDYGLLATIIYYIFLFIMPIFVMLKYRGYFFASSFTLTFLYLQTCNMTAVYYDFNMMTAYVAVLFMLLARHSYKYRKEVV